VLEERAGEVHHGDEVAHGEAGVQNHGLLHGADLDTTATVYSCYDSKVELAPVRGSPSCLEASVNFSSTTPATRRL
jgi:hypothetical protein